MLFAVNKRAFQIVPKRAFVSPEQEAAFRELLQRHIPKFGKWLGNYPFMRS